MVKKIVILVGMFVWLSTDAQVTQRNILTSKYSLKDIKESLISQESFKPYPTTPEEWKKNVTDKGVAYLITEGEKNLNFKFSNIPATVMMEYSRIGNRTHHQNLSFSKRVALLRLVLAESAENKGRFLDAIIDGTWSLCEESYWGVPAHIPKTGGIPDMENPVVDLFTAETASTLALVDYFVGNKMDSINPLFRKRLRYEINKRFFEPLAQNMDTDTYWYLSKYNKVNNWTAWIMTNWLNTTLLIEKDSNIRSEMVHDAMIGMDRYMNGLGEDGGCEEGPAYWHVAGGGILHGLEWLQKATDNKVDVFDNPFIHKVASYIYKVNIGKRYFVNIGDNVPEIEPLGESYYRIGCKLQDEQMKEFGLWECQKKEHVIALNHTLKMRSIDDYITSFQLPKMTAEYKPLNHSWFSDIQLMGARTKNNLYLSSHAGNNGKSHNHNDVGDFIIYLNDKPIIIDAGQGTYTSRTFSEHRYELWNTQSQHHNLPIINGYGESAGVKFGAKDVANINTDTEDKLVMDIAPAYPKEAGLLSWVRTSSLMREKDEIIITDAYSFKENPISIQQVFLTVTDVDISTEGTILFRNNKEIVILRYDATMVSVSTDSPSVSGADYGNLKANWHNKKITRILLTAKNHSMNGKFVYQFSKG